jgi:hypothetical protein
MGAASFSKIIETEKKFWATLFKGKSYVCINFDKNRLAHILGDFFTQAHLVTLLSK